ncbi:MAG TPA: primosomal protein N', partial [Candidatus Binatia bacterium]|nr:primosomal protein N' [Candidatus Binatia bacterium]
MNSSAAGFARVVIPSPLGQPLVYSVPAELRERVTLGMRVSVPLGKRIVTGVVLELLKTTTLTEVKPITALLDEAPVMDGALLFLIQWIARYYLVT